MLPTGVYPNTGEVSGVCVVVFLCGEALKTRPLTEGMPGPRLQTSGLFSTTPTGQRAERQQPTTGSAGDASLRLS